MGARVTQELNPISLLADAAEELTFSLAEGEESRLDERKEKAGAKGQRPFDSFIEAARKLLEDAGGKFGRAELMGAVKQALEQEGEPDPAISSPSWPA